MTNIVDFPVHDPIGLFMRSLRARFDAETWTKLEPIMATLIERHGNMPPFSKTMDLTRFKGLTPEECQEIGQASRQELIDYGTVCRGVVLAELAAALLLNAELREKLDGLKK